MRRRYLARRSTRRGHRFALPEVRPPCPSRTRNARAAPRRVRGARRSGVDGGGVARSSVGRGWAGRRTGFRRRRRSRLVTTAEETAFGDSAPGGGLAVFRNGGFLRLWMSQAATQIGGNMVLFGLTVIVVNSTSSNTAVGLLVL